MSYVYCIFFIIFLLNYFIFYDCFLWSVFIIGQIWNHSINSSGSNQKGFLILHNHKLVPFTVFTSFPLLDLPVGAEFGAVPHGSVSLSVLPGQPTGWRTPQPQTLAGLCFTSHQAGHGSTGHLLCLLLPCTGKILNSHAHFCTHPFLYFWLFIPPTL